MNQLSIETSYLPEELHFKVVPFDDEVDYDSLKLHRHNYLEIFIFTKGGGKHLIDFNEYKINDNELHFVFPNQVHLVRRSNDSQGFVILFKVDFLRMQANNPLQSFYTEFFQFPILRLKNDDFQLLQNIFSLLKQEVKLGLDSFNKGMVRSYLNAMLIQCLRFKNAEAQNAPTKNESDSKVNEFVLLVEKNYKIKNQVGDYLQLLNINSKKLTEVLRKSLGKSPKELISERISLEARRMLLYSNWSIKEISYDLGFNEPAHFTKFFIRMNGVNPAEFKNIWVEKYNS